ncbi:DUF2306 domain-containing protein [Cryobacterium sp. BB307]|uniref:DUF2306 domain-containing protein n=1 Tax=Cryobacterium sp. BB307 TaxID=2716317 RepID=UPI001445CF51|nr:DUF2306 domain-containing protein [Cryobacterium sp. BB307]
MTSRITITRTSAGQPQRDRTKQRSGWLAASGLILLSLIPVIAGMFRLTQLTGGAITADNARFFDSPIPVIAHIIGATVYCLLGAFQFVPALRRRRSWHRIAGLVLIPAGFVAAFSGLWMAAFYSFPGGDSALLMVIRLAFGSAMVACLVLGITSIRRRDFVAHGAWMTRAYALGIAAGTQALVFAVWILAVGPVDSLTDALLMGAAWVINAGVAEFVILRRARLARASGAAR